MPHTANLIAEQRAMVTMSFGDHLGDLRRRLILASLGLFAGIIASLIPPLNLGRLVFQQLLEPAQRTLVTFHESHARAIALAADSAGPYHTQSVRISALAFAQAIQQVLPDLPARPADALAGRYVELPQELLSRDLIDAFAHDINRTDRLIALGPMEPAVIFFQVCFVTGFVLSSPWVFYQLWAFVAAGLYRHEQMVVYRFLPYSLGLFLAGVCLCFFVVLPLTLGFLLDFNVWLGITPMLRLSDWMGFATILPLIFGLSFQTPLVMLLLSKIGIFTVADYRAKRSLAVLIIVVVAAMLTPGPDVSSMLLLSISMVLLYEIGILLVAQTRSEAARSRSGS
jgi:sec-independent protein translocase protein TatC